MADLLDFSAKVCYYCKTLRQLGPGGSQVRQSVSENIVHFCASDMLVSALSERARASGVTVSEYLRGVVREKVGLS